MKVKIFNWMHRYPQIFGKFLNWYELRCYKKAKCCDVCQYFQWYMDSVGVCTAQDGCPANRMKDVMDTCDCGKFKFKKVKLGD